VIAPRETVCTFSEIAGDLTCKSGLLMSPQTTARPQPSAVSSWCCSMFLVSILSVLEDF